ncbi:hypothetical protein [Proteus hauseri]|uniref:hypothetical protein n=1 Tax=Proteus hauseri TaxID=183417 RepID=UPI0010093F78|nr:hypothetical protein [Proteus hauseri]QAV23798.1 hypothetical protein PH4a_10800 [Proteus hauseri]
MPINITEKSFTKIVSTIKNNINNKFNFINSVKKVDNTGSQFNIGEYFGSAKVGTIKDFIKECENILSKEKPNLSDFNKDNPQVASKNNSEIESKHNSININKHNSEVKSENNSEIKSKHNSININKHNSEVKSENNSEIENKHNSINANENNLETVDRKNNGALAFMNPVYEYPEVENITKNPIKQEENTNELLSWLLDSGKQKLNVNESLYFKSEKKRNVKIFLKFSFRLLNL